MENSKKFTRFAKEHGVILEYAILFIIACFVVPKLLLRIRNFHRHQAGRRALRCC